MNPPRSAYLLTLGLGLLFFVGLAVVAILHRTYLVQHPLWIPWLTLSLVLGGALFFLNRSHISWASTWPWLGYGLLAAVVGFAIQSVVNGSLVHLFGRDEPFSSFAAIVLGFGSAVSQTAGKSLCLLLIATWLGRNLSPAGLLAAGLAIGLGFGLTEVGLLALQMVFTDAPLSSLIGVIERVAAVWFHLFSGGLLALAWLRRQLWPLLLVITLHTLLDGIAVAGAQHLPLEVLEGIFFLLAAVQYVVWLIYRPTSSR